MKTKISSLVSCPNHLNDAQIAQFRESGYLAFSDVLDKNELEEAKRGLQDLGARLLAGEGGTVQYTAPVAAQGSNNHSGAKFKYAHNRCMMQLEPGFDPTGCDAETVELKVRKYWSFCSEASIFQRIVGPGHKVNGVIESLLGVDSILFQEMALVKPPLVGSEKPWHQDNAYFSVAPLDAIVGVWIALDDATVENGCMHVIPSGHKIGALKHFHGSDCEIVEGRLDISRAEAVPVPAGGAMFFYGLLPHETPPNRSPERRRALQFHFRSSESRIVDEETYNRIFSEADGTPASCKSALTT